MINNPKNNNNFNNIDNEDLTFKKINKNIKNFHVSSSKSRKSVKFPNQNLKKQNIKFSSIQYDIFTTEGRKRLIRDFLFYDRKKNDNCEIIYARDPYFEFIYDECLHNNTNSFVIIDNSLYIAVHNSYRLCIPTFLLENVIARVHEKILHGSKRKIKANFNKYFFHPFAAINISKYSNKCLICRSKSITQIPGKGVNPGCTYIAKSSREFLDISIIRKLPTSRNSTSILIVVDVYTRYCIALPLKSTENSIVEKTLKKIFSTIGFPRCVRAIYNRDLNIALEKLADVIHFQILSRPDINIEIENKIKSQIYDEVLIKDKSNWIKFLPSIIKDLNNLPIDYSQSHMTRKEFFFKSTSANIFRMLGSTKIFKYVNKDIEAMKKFVKIISFDTPETIKKSKLTKKLNTIHSGDIVFLTDDIKSEIDTPKLQPTQLKLELFQVLKKYRKTKTIEIISLKTGQKCMTNKNLIRKIFVNEFISQDNAEECIRILLDKLKPVNINLNDDVYLCESNENKNTVNTLNQKSYLPEIEDMLDSFMDDKDKDIYDPP